MKLPLLVSHLTVTRAATQLEKIEDQKDPELTSAERIGSPPWKRSSSE